MNGTKTYIFLKNVEIDKTKKYRKIQKKIIERKKKFDNNNNERITESSR